MWVGEANGLVGGEVPPFPFPLALALPKPPPPPPPPLSGTTKILSYRTKCGRGGGGGVVRCGSKSWVLQFRSIMLERMGELM